MLMMFSTGENMKNFITQDNKRGFMGTIYTLAAFLMWGMLPGYWKMLKSVPSDEIVFHRIIWAFVISISIVFFTGRMESLKSILMKRKLRITVFLSSITIFVNWLIYVYAVNTGRIVEASLGYFINPLVSIFLGMVVLREKLKNIQIAAIAFAAAGVIYMTADFGKFPWIAITLAFSFGFYGLIKKMGDLDSISSLSGETLFLLPVAASVVLFKEFSGTGAMGNSSPSIVLILLGTGVVSALPLFLFAQGAKRIPLSRVGFIQYITPTMMLLIGVMIYRENFTTTHAVSFSLIWSGLGIYTASGLLDRKR